jgi:hypothetical protein
MGNKVLVLDTSMLCSWLCIPGKETCGPSDNKWDTKRVENYITEQTQKGATIVLPIATIIETGNHIAQSNGDRYNTAKRLADIMEKAADNVSPWAAFSDQDSLWSSAELKRLSREWPDLAVQKISIGDTTIKNVANYYSRTGTYEVEILTGDQGLKSYEPLTLPMIPRRRKR